MKKNKEWLKKNLERVLYNAELSGLFSTGITSSVNIVYDDVLTLIDQLDEPDLTVEYRKGYEQGVLNAIQTANESKLVEIPQFVADWIEHIKENKTWLTLSGAFNHSTQQAVGKTKDWILIGNSDLFARAWLDGYAIEKEKMYVVKINDQGSWLYLKSMQLYKDVESRTDLNSNFEAWKEKALKFTNKEQAEGIAKFFNGEVVEVMDNV